MDRFEKINNSKTLNNNILIINLIFACRCVCVCMRVCVFACVQLCIFMYWLFGQAFVHAVVCSHPVWALPNADGVPEQSMLRWRYPKSKCAAYDGVIFAIYHRLVMVTLGFLFG